MIHLQKKNLFKLSALALAVAAIVAPAAWSGGRAPVVNRSQTSVRAPVQQDQYDRFIVSYRDTSRAAKATVQGNFAAAATRLGFGINRLRTLSLGADLIRTGRKLGKADSTQLMTELMKDPNVLAVEADIIMTAQSVPNDPMYAQQWHYQNGPGGINLEPARDITKGGGVVVAVLDTGITPHSEFAGQVLPGYDFLTDLDQAADGDGRDADANDPGDWGDNGCYGHPGAHNSTWHGTHVAGTIAALTDNGKGTAGVAPNAKILPVRVMGKCGGYASDIMDGLLWSAGIEVPDVPANANPAEVVNMSLGRKGKNKCSVAFQAAVNAVTARGTTVVAGAGNSGTDSAGDFTPASCDNVIAVAAVDPAGARAPYSSYGTVVDVAAPGGGGPDPYPQTANVLSLTNLGLTTQGTEGYAWFSGTSMAAPHVAGVAALIQSASVTPKTPAQVKQIIENTAYANGGLPGRCINIDRWCGVGIVDARAAVAVASGAEPLPPNPPPPLVPPSIKLKNNVTVTNIRIGEDGKVRYQLTVPNGATDLLFANYGTGKFSKMYVKHAKPVTPSSFDCHPSSMPGTDILCFFPKPASGVWYVLLYNLDDYDNDYDFDDPVTRLSLYPSFVDANYPYREKAKVKQLANHFTSVALTWAKGKKDVDIYRNGLLHMHVCNTYKATDLFRIVGKGTMTYKICNKGTKECSNEVKIKYTSKP